MSAPSVAEPKPSILESTCAVVIENDESRLSILSVAGLSDPYDYTRYLCRAGRIEGRLPGMEPNW